MTTNIVSTCVINILSRYNVQIAIICYKIVVIMDVLALT